MTTGKGMHVCGRPLHVALLEAWIHGWALARETALPTRVPGGWHVRVGWPGQRERYVYPGISAQMVEAAKAIREPEILLKVCASPEAVRTALPARWETQRLGFVMSRDSISARHETVLPAGLALECTDASVAVARVLNGADEVLAIAHLSVVGKFAIYDRVETHEAHRRRGLGRAVIGALSSLAHARGARRGVLVATDEGRRLYEALGWQLRSLYTTVAMSPASEASTARVLPA